MQENPSLPTSLLPPVPPECWSSRQTARHPLHHPSGSDQQVGVRPHVMSSDTGYPPTTLTNTKGEGEEEGDLGKLKLRGRKVARGSLENGSSKVL